MLSKRLILIWLFILGGVFICLNFAQAADLGEQLNFYVDASYDQQGRSQVAATLKKIGNYIYFYVENDYWNDLSSVKKNALAVELNNLANEFDQVIYSKSRSVFGSEWNPGIDNDQRITVLLTQLKVTAGGYIRTHDEYLQSQVASSNQREMIYLNAPNVFSSINNSFLAHEFQHLISFYQKSVLYNLEEEVWLNESRSEYAPTACGYNDKYAGSYLADRVDIFIDSPTDPLGEWKNRIEDYGAASVFIHYLTGHYGDNLITQMVLNEQTGIKSVNRALANLGEDKTFSDIFADWAVANYLNDCQIGSGLYCYNNQNLNYQRLHVEPSASYSGFPNLIVSRSSAVKDWSPRWYRFRQGGALPTDRDTLKLEFEGIGSRANFRVPYIVFSGGQATVYEMSLTNQKGVAYIPNFTSQDKTVVMVPFNQYKTSGFTDNDDLVSFTFTAFSVSNSVPELIGLTPSQGQGGTLINLKGDNLDLVEGLSLGGQAIDSFELISRQEIRFSAPAHNPGKVDLVVQVANGGQAKLVNAFEYQGEVEYPDGSLLRARDGYKVYVVKGDYKRWIQTAEIFNYYRHLKWEDIIEVDQGLLDRYFESWLVRADGDDKVYELNADGTKHWLNMSAQEFSQSGRLWDMVYLINAWERDYYRIGSEIHFN